MSLKKVLILVGCLVFVCYLATFRSYIGNIDTLGELKEVYKGRYASAFESPHERSSYLLLLSLVQDRSLDLRPENAPWGGVDVGTYNGKIFSFFPPGLPLLSIPFFLIGKFINMAQAGSFLPVPIFASLNVLLIILISHRFFNLKISSSIFAGLLFAFATPSLSYAITYYQHHITTFLMLGSLYAAYLFSQDGRRRWVVATCILFGISWLFDYTNLVILFPSIVFLFLSSYRFSEDKHIANRWIIIIACIVIACSVLIYNNAVFGAPHITSNNLVRYNPSQTEIVTETQRDNIFDAFNPKNIPFGLYVILLAPFRGLFFFSPIYIFALWGIALFRKKFTAPTYTLLALTIATLFLYSIFKYPWGGWAFGPRTIIPAMATLAPFVALWLERSALKIKALIAAVLVSFSTALAFLGALTTNMIPYISRAHENGGDYTFKRLFEYMYTNKSPNLVYNSFFSGIPLGWYYAFLFVPLIIAFLFLIHKSVGRSMH